MWSRPMEAIDQPIQRRQSDFCSVACEFCCLQKKDTNTHTRGKEIHRSNSRMESYAKLRLTRQTSRCLLSAGKDLSKGPPNATSIFSYMLPEFLE